MIRLLLTFLFVCYAAPAFAWNALGHKVVAEIAWRQLEPAKRQAIVDTLRRHPAFDADFAKQMPDEVLSADRATQVRWIFHHAATWPDVARGGPYDQPWWHFVNHPYYLDESDRQLADRLPFNQSYEYPTSGELDRLNVVQAIKHALA